jgi:hypothetical protein
MRIASYYRRGFMMSRRAREAVANNERPLNYWKEKLAMEEDQIVQLLIYMGNHHVGSKGILTPFYRLPDKDDADELKKIYKFFHQVSAKKLNFIRMMSMHLQKSVDEKDIILPASQRPRKKTKRIKSKRKRPGGVKLRRRRISSSLL